MDGENSAANSSKKKCPPLCAHCSPDEKGIESCLPPAASLGGRSGARSPVLGSLEHRSRTPPESEWDRQDIDMIQQRKMRKLERSAKHEEWIEANAPRPLDDLARRHVLRSVLIASVMYHKQRGSRTLASFVYDIVAASRPDLLVPLSDGTSGLPKPLLDVLYSDIDIVLGNNGFCAARNSLNALPLWRAQESGRGDVVIPHEK